jgi:hypothetical protein
VVDGPDTAAVAGLTVEIRHRFTAPGQPPQTALIAVQLFGDGRYERRNSWESAPVPVPA